MECRDCKQLLDGYACGEIGGQEAASIAEHVQSCPDCARELEAYRVSHDVLVCTWADSPVADKAFFRGLKKRLDEVDYRTGRRHEPFLRWHFVGGVAAAAAAILIVANVLLPNFGGTPQTGDEIGGVATYQDSAQGPSDLVGGPLLYRPVVVYPSNNAFPSTSVAIPVFVDDRSVQWNAPSDLPVTRLDYQRLEKRLKELESRLEAIESAGNPPQRK